MNNCVVKHKPVDSYGLGWSLPTLIFNYEFIYAWLDKSGVMEVNSTVVKQNKLFSSNTTYLFVGSPNYK